MTRSRSFPYHLAPAPSPTLLQPEEGLVQLLHLAEVQQPRLLTARHGCGRPSGAPAAPGLSVRGEGGEPCREGTQTRPRGLAETPGRTQPLRSASRCQRRLHVPRSRGSAETRHCRAGRRGGGYGTSCQAAPSPAPAGDRRRQHPGAAPVPQRGPARSQSTRVPPGRGSLTPVTLRPGAAGVPRQAPHGRPAALSGERCAPQPSHHTHERARRAAKAPLSAEGDGCRGRAEPGLELPVVATPDWFGGQ